MLRGFASSVYYSMYLRNALNFRKTTVFLFFNSVGKLLKYSGRPVLIRNGENEFVRVMKVPVRFISL